MRRRFYHPIILSVLCLSFAFVGCGGSGGGSGGSDGGGGGSTGLNYTGETAPAEVDEDNADDIAAGAFDAGQSGLGMTVTNDGYCMLGNSTSIPIDQNGTYQFNSYARVSGDIDHLTIAIWKSEDPNEAPNALVGFINPNPSSGAYEIQQLTVDLSAGDYIRLELGIDNDASGSSSVLFDNLELVNN